MQYDPQLLDELARCYVQAALNELLREQANAQGSGLMAMKTTTEKDLKDIAGNRGVRAGLQP